MATLESQTSPLSPPEQPQSIQPGGAGWCVQLELAWGRCRRAWLRRFRPAYVRGMAEKRQGHCASCAHDIIDSRDLKFYRNVCGYSFRPEDDAFRWRDRLGLARAGLAEIIGVCVVFLVTCLAFGLAGALVHWAFWLPLALLLPLWFQLVYFFRDPERVIPTDALALLSPADGTITHVGEVDEPGFPGGRAFHISIFLSVFNVHVNRVPRSGRILGVQYFRGCFLDARHPECAARNEQLSLDLEEENTGNLIRVKQISGAIARRIVCWLKLGDRVQAGERFGMIKFGSRTNVYLALGQEWELKVRVGDKVKGGSSVLLRFKEKV